MANKSKKEKDEITYTCYYCGKNLPKSEFYKMPHGIYSKIGHLPLCKDCLNELFQDYYYQYKNEYKALKRICMMFDMYYREDFLDNYSDTIERCIGLYLRESNLMQSRKKSFEDNLVERFDFNSIRRKRKVPVKDEVMQPIEVQGKIDRKDIKKWGVGLDSPDYDVLNDHYKFLKEANQNCDNNQEIFIVNLCYIKMQQMRAIRNGNVDEYSKLTNSYIKTFQQAGLQTVEEKPKKEEFSIGINTEMIEKYTPAEYYKNKELYKDYDHIGEYIQRFVLRPLKNLMFGTEERDKEFYVKEDSGGINDDYLEDS